MSKKPNLEDEPTIGEDYRAMREHAREQRADRRAVGVPEILALREAGHQVRELGNGFQFRIDGALDLYPTNRRYHHLASGKRGGYGRETVRQIVDRLLPRR